MWDCEWDFFNWYTPGNALWWLINTHDWTHLNGLALRNEEYQKQEPGNEVRKRKLRGWVSCKKISRSQIWWWNNRITWWSRRAGEEDVNHVTNWGWVTHGMQSSEVIPCLDWLSPVHLIQEAFFELQLQWQFGKCEKELSGRGNCISWIYMWGHMNAMSEFFGVRNWQHWGSAKE